MNPNLRKFLTLLAAGAVIGTMQKNNLAEKSYQLTKESSAAVRQLRLDNNISEGDVMKALGLSDVNEYVAWENGTATLELSPENFTALAKVLKTDVATLAAKMISADGPDPKLDSDPSGDTSNNATNGSSGGDQTTPPAGGDGATKAKTAKSGQASIHPIEVIEVQKNYAQAKDHQAEKAHRTGRVAKALLGFDDAKYAKIQKAGLITPEDFAPNSTLNPQIGTDLVNVVVDQHTFLQQIQAKPVARQSAEILVADIGARKRQRQPPGWPDASIYSRTIDKSLTVNCEKSQYYLTIDDRTLMNYQGNLPGLETEILNMFTTQFGNDTVDLGFNGSASSGAVTETVFTNLNKGWMYLAQNGNGIYTVPAGQILTAATKDAMYDTGNHSTGVFKQTLMYDELISAAIGTNPRFFDDTTPIITGTADWRAHEKAMGQRTYDSIRAIVDGVEKKFEGRPVQPINYIATQNALHTQIKNLVYAVVTGTQGTDGITIERHRVPQATLFIFTMYDDYEFVNYDAIACVKPA